MPYWRHFYHLIWATPRREPMISPEIETPLHQYLSAKAQEIGCAVYAVNGMADHIHMVVSISPTCSVADTVKQLKGGSSHHVNTFLRPAGQFAWQTGYGSLTLGERQLSIAVAYVEKQKEHHRQNATNKWMEECGEIAAKYEEHA